MLPRDAEALLAALARSFPVVGITGPRQSGKTTLARHAFPNLHYVSLEDPDARLLAETDPRGFLAAGVPMRSLRTWRRAETPTAAAPARLPQLELGVHRHAAGLSQGAERTGAAGTAARSAPATPRASGRRGRN